MKPAIVEDSGTGQASGPTDTVDYEKWYLDTLGEYAQDNIVVPWELLSKGNL